MSLRPSEKQRQRRLRRKVRAKKQKTMFGPAKDKKLAEIISIESPAEAQESIDSLERIFDAEKKRSKKVAILRATVLAANRAEASRMRIGPKERKEMGVVAKKYRKSASGMSAILAKAEKTAKKTKGRKTSKREPYVYRRFEGKEFMSLKKSWLIADRRKAESFAKRIQSEGNQTRVTPEDGAHRVWKGPLI
jgi:hypothetical protein